MTTKKHDPDEVKAVIEALEALVAEPTGVNMMRYSDLALPFLLLRANFVDATEPITARIASRLAPCRRQPRRRLCPFPRAVA